jgi:glycosyltransferase involved in cell wall biosynthesis
VASYRARTIALRAVVILGLLPEMGGGLRTLARSGQHVRFVNGYLRAYVRAFEQVRYFSYGREAITEFTDDATVTSRVSVVPGASAHRWVSTMLMGLRQGGAMADLSVFRVFHLTGAIPALVARRRFGVPFATTYGFRYDRLARTPTRAWLHRGLERLALAEADAVIVTTPELASYVGTRTRSRDVVHLLPNAVDTAAFRPIPRTSSAVPTILYVGRLSPEKNLGGLIAAAGKLRARRDLRLRFVGDGVLRDALPAEARRAGVSLELLPVLEHERLPAVYAAADVFVLPSFTEGHAKVLLEAMSCGVPCVASDVGGNRATVRDGHTGLLVDPADPGAMADAIDRVLTDPELAQRLGEMARQEVVEHYDLGSTVGHEVELLRRLSVGRTR